LRFALEVSPAIKDVRQRENCQSPSYRNDAERIIGVVPEGSSCLAGRADYRAEGRPVRMADPNTSNTEKGYTAPSIA